MTAQTKEERNTEEEEEKERNQARQLLLKFLRLFLVRLICV